MNRLSLVIEQQYHIGEFSVLPDRTEDMDWVCEWRARSDCMPFVVFPRLSMM